MKAEENTGLTLYTYWRSSAAYRVRIALNLKGLSFKSIPVHLVRQGGEQRGEAFRTVNPQGLVPVLLHEGNVLTQSMAICEYLDERFDEYLLLPADPLERARVRSMALQIACDIHPLNNLRVLQYLKTHCADAWDAGVTLRTADGRGELDLTYFNQDTTDLIDFSFAVGGFENIAQAKSSGVELFGGYHLTEWAEMTAEYSYIDSSDGMGNELPRVPKHSGNVTLIIDPAGPFSGSALVRYNGKEQDANGSLDSWTRVDLTARYAINDRIEFYGRIENLLDVHYQQVLGYGTPGLSGSAGARLSF